jgi:tetratricopeptide (TPR) repeat protein
MVAVFAYARWIVLPLGYEQAYLERAGTVPEVRLKAEEYEAAGEANPLAWEPAFARGQALLAAAGDPPAVLLLEQAVAAYREAIRRQPRLRRAYVGAARAILAVPGALQNPEALARARELLEEAVRLYPTRAATHVALGEVLSAQGETEAARAALERALELDDVMPDPDRRLPPAVRAEAEAALEALGQTAGPGDAEGVP